MSVNYLDITNIGAMHYNTSSETYCFVDNSVLLHNEDWRNNATSDMEFVLVKFRKFSDPNHTLNTFRKIFFLTESHNRYANTRFFSSLICIDEHLSHNLRFYPTDKEKENFQGSMRCVLKLVFVLQNRKNA